MSASNTAMSTSWNDSMNSENANLSDPLSIEKMDHLEILSGNARQTAYYYCQAFGFRPIAYRGPETGHRESASYVLRQNDLTFVITSPLTMTHWIANKVFIHGDTVRDNAFTVTDCEAFFNETLKRGATAVQIPTTIKDENGTVKRASIATYGDVIHSIIERKDYRGLFLPGFVPYEDIFRVSPPKGKDVGLKGIDHIVGNVEHMEEWVEFYERVLGFSQIQHFGDDVSTEYSALMSKVMQNGTGRVKFPINEPATGKRKSQIQEYLEFNYGPGVQHIALVTDDIIKTVTEMRARGVNFLDVPKTYYDEVPKRVGTIKEDLKTIADLGILVDRDDEGYLLQIFTQPVQDRPTLFFEVIQREGSQGFGIGNFKALFEAIEREQERRGNL